jgi:hypothetical protein
MEVLQKTELWATQEVLSEHAEYLAAKMKTTEEKALRAIMRAEEARRIYQNIKELLGKQQQIFTQVDVMNPSNDVNSPLITLTQQLLWLSKPT